MKEWFSRFKEKLLEWIDEITFSHVLFVITISTLMGINVYHYYQSNMQHQFGITFTIWMIGISLLIVGLCISTILLVIAIGELKSYCIRLENALNEQSELIVDVSRTQDDNQNIVISKLNEVEKIILEQHDNINNTNVRGE